VLDLPIYRAQGPSRIHDAVAVHAAFTAENTVGDIEWDDE
jgi:hypothetical protein